MFVQKKIGILLGKVGVLQLIEPLKRKRLAAVLIHEPDGLTCRARLKLARRDGVGALYKVQKVSTIRISTSPVTVAEVRASAL